MKNNYSEIVREITESAKIASQTPRQPEGKLRELVAPMWSRYLKSKQLDLNFEPRDELTLANGTADTVFNRLILEYKKPGTIKSRNEKNRQLITQVQGYIEDLAKKEGWKEQRLLGVAFDGLTFLYIRKVRRWIIEDPVPISEKSIERFFLTLESLTGKTALIPENLIRDFAVGTNSLGIAARTIRAFYSALTHNVNPKVSVFFEQWKLQFSEVHGSLEGKKFDDKVLLTAYGFDRSKIHKFDYHAFFFSLDTYYALLIKLLAYQVVGFYSLGKLVGLPLRDWEGTTNLKEKIEELEQGGVFKTLGVRNFLEGDLLSWYLNDWDRELDDAVRGIIARLNGYDPQTMELLPDETRDILKKLYQFLVPKSIRHDLGEYYTPDWLAERCLNQVNYGPKERELLNRRVLDPSCGSGTFLILAIKRAKEHARLREVEPAKTLDAITRNIVGFDLNPLAVISARTNYLLAIADLLPFKKEDVTIPVYLCDSINPPRTREQADLMDVDAGHYIISTSVGRFRFPEVLVEKELVPRVTLMLEDGVKKNLTKEKFIGEAERELKLDNIDKKKFELVLGETFGKLLDLEHRGINGIWARIIKNAFAPLFMGTFDTIVGNPPWVNWESLPDEYREETKPLWQYYGLFSLSGHAAQLGGGKKDISMLMTYVAVDKYLRKKGKLCFVITQTLFKTQGAGDGFRRFQIGQAGPKFRVDQLDDMVDLQPFEGATNRTAVVLCTKDEATKYPLPYLRWLRKGKGKIELDYSFEEVNSVTVRKSLSAQPVGNSPTSPWMSSRPKALSAARKVVGKSYYAAAAGSCTWLNGVFWGNASPVENGILRFSNLANEGRIKINQVEAAIETTLVYPLLRGRDVTRWNSSPKASIIVPQDPKQRSGFELHWMKENVPKTLTYLKEFEEMLLQRSGYEKYLHGEPFYSIYNVDAGTFARHKVVWKEQSSEFECAVVSSFDGKVIVPDHKLMLVPFDNDTEAHYVCALLNSVISRFIVQAYTISTQQSTHILENIRVPKYDQSSQTHKDLARLSKQCHEKVAAGIGVTDLEDQIDHLAAELWGLTEEELEDIRNSLEEMR